MPKNTPKNALIYVEDPGAANFIIGLPDFLKDQLNLDLHLLAGGMAFKYLKDRGISCEEYTSQDASAVLEAYDLDAVMVGTSENPDSLGLALVNEAHKSGVITIGLLDNCANADYRFRGRTNTPLYYAPDWLVLPDIWTKEAYVSLGYPADRAVICGHPHYDLVKRNKEEFSRIKRSTLREVVWGEHARDKKVVIFAAEVSSGLADEQYHYSKEYTLHGRGSTSRTAIVLEEFLAAVTQIEQKPYLVLRLHPKNKPEEFSDYLEEFDQISQGGIPLQLVYAADLIVGMTSMLMVEAVIMGRPTLSILPRVIEKEWLPTLRFNLTPYVTTRTDLCHILPELLCQQLQPCYDIVEQVLMFNSQERIRDFLKSIL